SPYYYGDIGFPPPPYYGEGGAILNLGTLTLSGCILSHNSAILYGGAIANFRTLTVIGCTLSNNSGGSGGGLYNPRTLAVNGSTLSGNIAGFGSAGDGGGIYNDYLASATVSGCTLSGNSAYAGGGIYNAGKLTVSNSVFTGNTPDNIFGVFIDGGGNIFK